MKSWRSWRTVGWTAGLLLLALTNGRVVEAKSGASRVDQLKSRREETVAKRHEVEAKLRAARRQQAFAMDDFYTNEQKLAKAEAALHTAKLKAAAAEDKLHSTQAALDQVTADLAKHTAVLWQRLDAFDREGTLGYVSVALGAVDFDQFVDRAALLRTVAEEDVALKQQIVAEQTRKSSLAAEQASSAADLETLKADEAARTQELAQVTEDKRQVLEQAKHDRAAQDAVYEELLSTQKEIDSTLYSLQNPAPHVSVGGGESGGGSIVGYGGGATHFTGSFIKPCSGRFSSPFGWRIHPILGTRRFHDGQDIAAPYGTTIHAAAAGTVVRAGTMKAYGNVIMIDHGGGVVTLYGHCSSLLVSVGTHVAQGQPIARVGSTGWSTGPHCHFSIYHNGQAVNPMASLR